MPKKPLGIYVHIPFCVRKCLYCDFLSGEADEDTKIKYVQSLLSEIDEKTNHMQEQLEAYEVVSIFFGGGTPSVLPAEQIGLILCKLKERFCIKDAEISIEVNPGTVSGEWLCAVKESGVNRISIGVQSLQDGELERLGRIHRSGDFYRVYEEAECAGFRNKNVDLMSGIPGQTPESLKDTLEKIIALGPEHISAYSLIIEEGTPFARMYPDGAVSEETDREMYELTGRVLSENGYHRYEISNYAKRGYECRHNSSYWTRQEYLGFGIGAASLFSHTRYANICDLKQYLDGNRGYEKAERLEVPDEMAETMFLGLRMMQGVSVDAFYGTFGKTMEEIYGEVIHKHMEEGLLVLGDGFLKLTDKGIDVSNYVMADFLPDV